MAWGGVNSFTFLNNELIANPNELCTGTAGGTTFTTNHISDCGRAAGDAMSFNILTAGNGTFAGNTLVGYGTEFMLFGCWDSTCTGTTHFADNIFSGQTNPAWSSKGQQTPPNLLSLTRLTQGTQALFDHNDYYTLKGSYCPTESGSICTNPALGSASTYSSEAAYDSYNFTPTAGSPALHSGVSVSGLTTDYVNATRPNPPSMGAVE